MSVTILINVTIRLPLYRVWASRAETVSSDEECAATAQDAETAQSTIIRNNLAAHLAAPGCCRDCIVRAPEPSRIHYSPTPLRHWGLDCPSRRSRHSERRDLDCRPTAEIHRERIGRGYRPTTRRTRDATTLRKVLVTVEGTRVPLRKVLVTAAGCSNQHNDEYSGHLDRQTTSYTSAPQTHRKDKHRSYHACRGTTYRGCRPRQPRSQSEQHTTYGGVCVSCYHGRRHGLWRIRQCRYRPPGQVLPLRCQYDSPWQWYLLPPRLLRGPCCPTPMP